MSNLAEMPCVAGIGLIALDVVIDESANGEVREWAGGSCGNVLAILAYFGWDADPIARLDHSPASRRIVADLKRWGVSSSWLHLMPRESPPTYIERLSYDEDGLARHRFDRRCPTCGRHLPQYRPVTRDALQPLLKEIAEHDVLYIDRPSPGAVLAAEFASERGTFVYFEPSARGEARHLRRIAAVADIVKYSADRLTDDDRKIIAGEARGLEIETLGAQGLRHRTTNEPWKLLRAPPTAVTDTAGAGDWLSAGLLHELFGSAEQSSTRLDNPTDVLDRAQALAAFSCRFVGPRGAMENQEPNEALDTANSLITDRRHTSRRRRAPVNGGTPAFSCGSCR